VQWKCHCGHRWNAFDTAARCPECGFQHTFTRCPDSLQGCNELSPHLDWYEGLNKMMEELLVEIPQTAQRNERSKSF